MNFIDPLNSIAPFGALAEQENSAKQYLALYLSLYPESKVVLFGFSFGGDTATLSSIPSDTSYCRNGSASCLVITLDPISRFETVDDPRVFNQSSLTVGVSARRQINYRQNWAGCLTFSPLGVPISFVDLRGYAISGSGTTNTSVDFRQKGHCAIDDDSFMLQRIVDDIESFLKQP